MDDLFRAFITLGVRPGSTSAQVRAAYRRLARETHPDRIQIGAPGRDSAERRMREINHAYELLRSMPDALARTALSPDGDAQSMDGLDPFSWRESMARGVANAGENAAGETAEFYRRALTLHFDGLEHYRAARWRDSVSCLSQTVFMVRDNPEAWKVMARAYRRLNQPQKAEAAYREALRMSPRDPEAHLELGETCLSMGDLAGARREAAILAEFDPPLANQLVKEADGRQPS